MASVFQLTVLLLSFSLLISSSVSDDEKETHLHFYFHDIVVGVPPTAMRIAKATTTDVSLTGFGALVMMDDPLTEEPDRNSKLIGKAQGMYGLASQDEAGLLMAMNLVFVDGEFNGSTLSVLGRNAVFNDVREMPVIGGSGKFRFARGYALAKTHEFSLLTGNAVVEYNVHIRHE
ncbi:uncharacterized protein A4U43_C06F8590 [Asparagus officinalis]|uniref:Dirigent protein n=1 Tax=Asparagus officinalis TaxID=4686 RepID=A0A5P1EKF5_ASPOF|nr:dirigent protein 21-like [Asparagus officinalis]ONK66478.1 uncharacterized protein A4U43_C06F8590 [Asparagus officinalis]